MKFHDYPDNLLALRKSGLAAEFGINTRAEMYEFFGRQGNPLGIRHMNFDAAWILDNKPYYDVYPTVIPLLTRLNLKLPGTAVSKTGPESYEVKKVVSDAKFEKLSVESKVKAITEEFRLPPLPHILIRLPEAKHELTYEDPKFGTTPVRTIFVSFQPVNRHKGVNEQTIGICVGIDIGERDTTGILPMHTMKVFPLDERPVEEVLNALPPHPTTNDGMQMPDDLIIKCVKLAITVRLLADDPEIIEPDVLSKDRNRMKDADDELKQKLIDKARRKGKNGFKVGERVENSKIHPHYRIPHPALVWTGEGRTIPRVVMRKGTIVHRKSVEEVPTGYLGDGTE